MKRLRFLLAPGMAMLLALLLSLLSAITTAHAGAAIIHAVEPGDTLGEIAILYGVNVEDIIVANSLVDPDLILVGQELLVPNVPGRVVVDLPDPLTSLQLPVTAVQGSTWTVRLGSRVPITPAGAFDGHSLYWVSDSEAADDEWAYWALVGVHPLAEPGVKPLSLSGRTADGAEWSVSVDIEVTAGVFETYALTLSAETSMLLAPDLVRSESARLAAIWAVSDASPRWQATFTTPARSMWQVSSAYGQRRSYNGGAPSSYHEGVDYGASQGALVLAPAAGRVVLAEPLTVRGNAVILDHGAGVHTGYWHLWQVLVAEGQTVEQGAPLARVGSTGLSTGPHLHWELRVGDVAVDPLQWTRQRMPGGNDQA